jgi:hypothetical protein
MVLFHLATARLVKEKILLPGVTTLTRLVASVRDRAAARLWRILAGLPSPEQRGRLLSLLRPGASGDRFSLKPKGGFFTRPEFRLFASYAIWSKSGDKLRVR